MSFVNNLLHDVYGAFKQASNSGGGISSGADVPTQMKAAKDDIVPGDIEILQIKAFKGQAVHDMMSQVTEFHIFESIISPVIFAHVEIADGIDLQDKFDFNGDDTYVYVEFQTPGATKEKIKYIFKVNKVSGLVNNTSNSMKTFSLQLISPEVIAAMDRDMEGFQFGDTAKNLIEKILVDKIENNSKIAALRNAFDGAHKKHNFNETKGIIGGKKFQMNYLPRNRKPFQAIHQICQISNLTHEGHALHTFFENRDGYNFKTIEGLMEEGKKELNNDRSDRIFIFDNLRNENSDGVKIRNILAYNHMVSGDSGEAGALGIDSEMRTFNPETGKIEIVNNDVQAASNSSELISKQAERDFDKTRSDLIISSETKHLHEVIDKRRRLVLRLSQFEAQIMIYGDTNLAVGDVIECIFPSSTTGEGEINVPSKESGYYLITHLRHIILNTERPQHIITCNLMKAERKKD